MQRRRRNNIAFKSNPIHCFLLRYLLAPLIRASKRAGTGWHHSGGNLWSLINQMCPQTVGTRASEENPLRHQENMRNPRSVGKSPPAASGRSFKLKSDAFIQPGTGARRDLELLSSALRRVARPHDPSELFIDPQ